MDKSNDIISFSKYLFFNGIINEDGIKTLFEHFIKNSNSKKNTNMISYLIQYFLLMKKSRKKLVDDKRILKTFKKLQCIYNGNKKKTLLRSILKWREKIFITNRRHKRNISTVSNSESNRTFISKNSVDRKPNTFNENYLRNLMEMSEKCKLHSYLESDIESYTHRQKTLQKTKTCRNELNKSNSKLNVPVYNKNYENPKKNKKSTRQANCLSPNHSKANKTNKANLGFKERIFVYSNKSQNSMCYESPLRTTKELTLTTTKRHDYLYNLHKQKEMYLKKLEENINQEKGITFKPKLNSKSINKSSSNLIKHTRTESLPRYDFINTYNSYVNICSPKYNKSLSQKNLVRSYETTENTNLLTNDILKTKESYLNNEPNTIYNQTKESISTIGKAISEAFNSDSCFTSAFTSKKSSVLTTRKLELKAKFKYQKKSNFLSENESLTNYKSETNTSSIKPDENKIQNLLTGNKGVKDPKIECIDNITSDGYSIIPTEIRETNSRIMTNRIQNPFNIDNYNDKEILEIANNYITTDESLDKFQKDLKKDTIDFGLRYNIKQRHNNNNKNDNFSFKNQISKERTLNSNNSLANHPINTSNSNKLIPENIQKALQFYNIANN